MLILVKFVVKKQEGGVSILFLTSLSRKYTPFQIYFSEKNRNIRIILFFEIYFYIHKIENLIFSVDQ